MPYLALNGVEIPVAADSNPTVSLKRLGAASRSYGGQQRHGYRAPRREWKFRTVPLAQAEAEALRALIDGKALAWSFENTADTDSGLTPASAVGLSYSVANVLPGALATYSFLAGYTGRVLFNLPRSTDWTLVDHAYLPSAAWQSRVFRSDGTRWRRLPGGALVREDTMDSWHQTYDAATGQLTLSSPVYGGQAWAASQARALDSTHAAGGLAFRVTAAGTTGATAPAWPGGYGATVTDGTVTWKNIGSDASRYAVLAWLPFKVPDAWVAQLTGFINAGNTFTSPWLLATGTFTAEPWLRVAGESGEGELIEFAQGGTRVVGEAFDFILRET